MLEVIDLMACLRSSVGSSYFPVVGIISSMVSQVCMQQLVSELMVFVKDSSVLDEEDVKSMEFGRGIKIKKTTRKFRFVLR